MRLLDGSNFLILWDDTALSNHETSGVYMTNDMLETAMEALDLKKEERSWIELFGIEESESVAGHSWSVAFLTLFFGRNLERIDMERALRMAVVHDLAETEVGDIIVKSKVSSKETTQQEKISLEEDFWRERQGSLGELKQDWDEYEERKSAEARFVKDMDLIDLCLQALIYEHRDSYSHDEENGDTLERVFETSEQSLNTEKGKSLYKEIRSLYEESI